MSRRAHVSVHQCNACGGWFCSGDALDELVRTVWTRLADLSLQQVDTRGTPGLACPLCSAALVPCAATRESGVVDRCPSCNGFWLDPGELEGLRRTVAEIDEATLARIMGTKAGRRLEAAIRRPGVPDLKLRRDKPPHRK